MKACPNPPPVSPPRGRGKRRSECIKCGACAEACYSGARKLVGRKVTVDEVVQGVERDRPFYEQSGGGVTFSGGEPLLQGDFLLECLSECRHRGLHTAVDTCGYAERGLLLETANLADLFLFDLKIFDGARHRRLTGAPVEPILDNLRALDETGAEILVRLPLIPGVTDARDNLAALGRYVASLGRSHSVQMLPFHRTASDKYARMGLKWAYGHTGPMPQTAVEDAAAILRGFGLRVLTNGRIYDGKSEAPQKA
jgi:pyruvate formate lyase activating enzyme